MNIGTACRVDEPGSEATTIPKRILVVDDDRNTLELLQILLTDQGFHIETATSGRQALTLLERNPFSLVVTDFNMPGMKGDELAVRVKELWPRMPVVMLTGLATLLKEKRQRMPAVDFLCDKSPDIVLCCREISRLLEIQGAAEPPNTRQSGDCFQSNGDGGGFSRPAEQHTTKLKP